MSCTTRPLPYASCPVGPAHCHMPNVLYDPPSDICQMPRRARPLPYAKFPVGPPIAICQMPSRAPHPERVIAGTHAHCREGPDSSFPNSPFPNLPFPISPSELVTFLACVTSPYSDAVIPDHTHSGMSTGNNCNLILTYLTTLIRP